MIWFWIAAGILILAALLTLLMPLLRGAAEAVDQSQSAVAVFRRELAGIDSEIDQGRLAADEVEPARAEVTRRMLAGADQESRASSPDAGGPAELSWRIGAAVGIAGLLPAATLGIYLAVGAPAAIDRGVAAEAKGQHEISELAAAVDQLKMRLQRDPGQVEGWILLGRSSASLRRFAEAHDAYDHAIALAPDKPTLHAELGEVLVLESEGTVTPQAAAEFAKAGDDPRARFYGAEAALQRGDNTAAKTALRALLDDAPADAPWHKFVAARLAEIAPDKPRGNSNSPGPPAGPTAQDVAAAQSLSPEQRQALIRGMVDRLAARLEQNPEDGEGWVRLAHAYDVLGETDRAQAARSRAAAIGVPEAATPPPAAPAPTPQK